MFKTIAFAKSAAQALLVEFQDIHSAWQDVSGGMESTEVAPGSVVSQQEDFSAAHLDWMDLSVREVEDEFDELLDASVDHYEKVKRRRLLPGAATAASDFESFLQKSRAGFHGSMDLRLALPPGVEGGTILQ